MRSWNREPLPSNRVPHVHRPVRAAYRLLLIHATTPQAAGRLLKKEYPGWLRIDELERMTERPMVISIPSDGTNGILAK